MNPDDSTYQRLQEARDSMQMYADSVYVLKEAAEEPPAAPAPTPELPSSPIKAPTPRAPSPGPSGGSGGEF